MLEHCHTEGAQGLARPTRSNGDSWNSSFRVMRDWEAEKLGGSWNSPWHGSEGNVPQVVGIGGGSPADHQTGWLVAKDRTRRTNDEKIQKTDRTSQRKSS